MLRRTAATDPPPHLLPHVIPGAREPEFPVVAAAGVPGPAAGVALPCCVEVPEAFLPKAQYAIRMLLLPLGIDPVWVEPGALGERGLYYGTGTEHAGVVLHHDPAAVLFFGDSAPFPAARARSVEWEGESWPVLFGGEEIDLVASTFFWLSGWQEVVSAELDEHGRFPHAASLQHALGITTRPVVDAYREMLARRLQGAGIALHRRKWSGRSWALSPTHDIDYLRKWRPGIVYREIAHHLLRNDRGLALPERLRRLGAAGRSFLSRTDPYREAIVRMHELVAERGGTATYFFKAAARDPHDVPYRLDGSFLRERFDAMRRDGFEVGLHPTYVSHDDEANLREERDRLAGVWGAPLVSVRQHYLRYDPIATPRIQEAVGFGIDSTLGFAQHEGFRHGTCCPFRLYDSSANRARGVWEMPLALMESVLFTRREMCLDRALSSTRALLERVRRFGGIGVVLWHNVIWDELDYPEWGQHFEETLAHAFDGGALVSSLGQALAAWAPVDGSASGRSAGG